MLCQECKYFEGQVQVVAHVSGTQRQKQGLMSKSPWVPCKNLNPSSNSLSCGIYEATDNWKRLTTTTPKLCCCQENTTREGCFLKELPVTSNWGCCCAPTPNLKPSPEKGKAQPFDGFRRAAGIATGPLWKEEMPSSDQTATCDTYKTVLTVCCLCRSFDTPGWSDFLDELAAVSYLMFLLT